MNDVKVTVFCLAYNHEKYIKKALDGFVMQKTNFKFEVLVHDDASADNTPNIIAEYAEKYPDIIIPILQKENQFSKHIPIAKTYFYPIMRGKYIAICEGDDFWTDEYKLQKQYDFMEANPDYSACVHCAIYRTVDNDGKMIDKVVPNISNSIDFNVEDTIVGGGDLVATNSMFRRKEVVISIPDCFKAKGFGDYQAMIYASICGKVHCFSDIMSVYNYQTEGSWTRNVWANPKHRLNHLHEEWELLSAIDNYYKYKYHKAIEKKYCNIALGIYAIDRKDHLVQNEPYKSVCKKYFRDKKRGQFINKIIKVFPFLKVVKSILR